MPVHRAAIGVFAARLAVGAEVGEVVDLGKAVGVVLVHDVDLDRTEAPGEDHLVARLEMLLAEQQQLMAQERLVDSIEQRVGHRPRQIDAKNLDSERRT